MIRTLFQPARPLMLIGAALLILAACNASVAASGPSGGQTLPDGNVSQPGVGGGAQPGGGGQIVPDEPIKTDPCAPAIVNGPYDGPLGEAHDLCAIAPDDGALVVTPGPGIVNAIPHAFDHITFAADGTTATIYYWGGVEECYGLADASIVANDDGTFTVTVLEGSRRAAEGQACIDIAQLKAVVVTLEGPLFVAAQAAGQE